MWTINYIVVHLYLGILEWRRAKKKNPHTNSLNRKERCNDVIILIWFLLSIILLPSIGFWMLGQEAATQTTNERENGIIFHKYYYDMTQHKIIWFRWVFIFSKKSTFLPLIFTFRIFSFFVFIWPWTRKRNIFSFWPRYPGEIN